MQFVFGLAAMTSVRLSHRNREHSTHCFFVRSCHRTG